MRGDEAQLDIDAALIPLQAAGQQALLPVPPVVVPGQLRSVAGQVGPDLNVTTAAAVNGLAVTFSAAANQLTFGLSGVGTMAQRNAIAAVADIATANATDLPTVIALANDLKAKLNQLLAAMRTASHLAP